MSFLRLFRVLQFFQALHCSGQLHLRLCGRRFCASKTTLRDFYIDERGLNVFLKTVVRSAENVDKILTFVDVERTDSATKGLAKRSSC
jgi:hypothetical protein